MIPYGRQWIGPDDIEAVTRVLQSDFLTQGPAVEAFESALTAFTEARYAVVFSSGTAALHAAYFAAGVTLGDEVITSPITFAATSNAALYLGATPVFVDVEPDTGNMDVACLEQAVTPKTKAIVPVHYGGHPADLNAVSLIAKQCSLVVIEDASHALGAKYRMTRGRNQKSGARTDLETDPDTPASGYPAQDHTGNWLKIGNCACSDMTVFSFHPVKHITTGEGGAVLTNRSDYHERLILFRSHGITRDSEKFKIQNSQGDWYYEMQSLGFNYRMSDIQATLGMSQLRKLDHFVSRRREIAEKYGTAFAYNPWFATPCERGYVKSSYHLYPIRLSQRLRKEKNRIFSSLKEADIGVQVHYIPVYLHPYYLEMGYKKGQCPAAEDFYQREISIPLHPLMNDEDVDMVINAVRRSIVEG